MSRRSNAGFFEPVLAPVGVKEVDAPHGIRRLIASQREHLTDLARLAGAFDHEEGSELSRRDSFIADAAIFATNCGLRGAHWEDVEPMIDSACALARVELTADERRELLEVWIAAEPLEPAA